MMAITAHSFFSMSALGNSRVHLTEVSDQRAANDNAIIAYDRLVSKRKRLYRFVHGMRLGRQVLYVQVMTLNVQHQLQLQNSINITNLSPTMERFQGDN
jgi:hypothetical protein